MLTGVEILVRGARRDDLDSCVGLLAELFSIEKDFEVRPARQRAGLQLLMDCSRSLVLVAESDGEVVGMATLQVVVSTAEGGLSGLVEDVVVRSDRRGHGIGTRLLDGLERRAAEQGITRLQLLADRGNTGAQAFYRACEWRPTRMENWQKKTGIHT